METGIEPVCTVLQTVASPLGHSTVAIPPQAQSTRADDETRTRDPHLGKVMRYQLRYIRVENSGEFSVGDTGFEPVTSSVSGKRATAAPIALAR